jgi:hypothetical protein
MKISTDAIALRDGIGKYQFIYNSVSLKDLKKTE